MMYEFELQPGMFVVKKGKGIFANCSYSDILQIGHLFFS